MENTDNRPRYLTIEAALSEVNIMGFELNIRKLRYIISNNHLPFFKIGNKLYINQVDLHDYFKSLRNIAIKTTQDNSYVSTKSHM